MTSSDSSSRSASSASTVNCSSCALAMRARSRRRGLSSASTRSREIASKRGCSAESFTEIPGRAAGDGGATLPMLDPMAAMAAA